MKWNILIKSMAIFMVLWGCEENTGGNGDGTPTGKNSKNDWLIPKSEVFDGGPGKDGIPALIEPNFIPAIEAGYLDDDDLVLGFVVGAEARA
jgi:hypothetical protein